MKSGSEDDVILQLVSGTFLHLQSTISTEPKPKDPRKAIAVSREIEKEG